jgi:thiamine monophosphate kinase
MRQPRLIQIAEDEQDMAGEFELIARHFTRAGRSPAPDVVLGVGDDCALLAPAPGQLPCSTDLQPRGRTRRPP